MKRIHFLCLFTLLTFVAEAQNIQVHNKYWYYRTRLRNDFMKVGLGTGCSIPMEERGVYYQPYGPFGQQYGANSHPFDFSDPNSGTNAKWGDAMGELGYYIGTLAMEYHLLVKNNQETDSVRYELYCALEALNRIDYNAEYSYSQAINFTTYFQNSFNGFMLRDDVPSNFITNNLKSFNYFGNRGFCSKLKLKGLEGSSGMGATTSDYGGSYISQDNWYNCLVGLALVRKFVPSGVSYNSASFMDGNGPDINQEAFSIALRVMNYFKKDVAWNLMYPETFPHFIGSNNGGTATLLAFPHAEALNKMNQNKWGNYVTPDALSFNTWCEYNNWRTDGNWIQLIYKNVVAIPLMYVNYLVTSHASGSLGNIYTQEPLIVPLNAEANYKFLQLYMHQTHPDAAVMISNLSAVCNCEYLFRGVDTKSRLQLHINDYGIWHPELVRVVLHGNEDCGTTKLNMNYFANATNLLNSAPCEGPFCWSSSNQINYGPLAPYEWSSTSRLDHPQRRGNGNNDFIGEYNGLDYMFYHNLVTVINADYFNDPNVDRMVDLGRRHITTNYPTTINGQPWGTTANPATVKAYEYIVTSNNVGVGGDVTYLAGKEIEIRPGFGTGGGNFTAAIKHFECDEILTNPINSATNARGGHIDSTNTNQSIYPDLLATSFESKKSTHIMPPLTKQDDKVPSVNLMLVSSNEQKQDNNMITNIVAEVAPNPTSGLCKVFLTNPNDVISIEVMDAFTQTVINLKTISYSNDINLTSFAKGLYMLIIKGTKGNTTVKKIVLQ
jgi:hypothetical protein